MSETYGNAQCDAANFAASTAGAAASTSAGATASASAAATAGATASASAAATAAAAASASAASQPSHAMQPSLEEVQRIFASTDFARVPVKRELYADMLTPIEAMRRLRAASNHCFLLESAEADKSWGRYTFLGFNPSMEITCADGQLTVRTNVEGGQEGVYEGGHERGHEGGQIVAHDSGHESSSTSTVENPSDALRRILASRQSAQLEGFPPFTGGLVGYFSYDFIKYVEPTLRPALEQGEGDFLDLDLMLFDSLICFDAVKQKIVLMTGVYAEDSEAGEGGEAAEAAEVGGTGEAAEAAEVTTATREAVISASYAAAAARLNQIERILTAGPTYHFAPLHLKRPLTPRFSCEEYIRMVETAKHHIVEGDIFQVVLSNPQTAPATGSLFDAYRALRCANPSPYMFYFTSDDVEIAGASPETLVRLRDGVLNTYPLAGTRPRGTTPQEDAALEAEVLADEKERAEHNMLVDLGRNDLGRISEIGSVEVDSYMQVLKFSRVMHIGSTVTSRIAPGRDAIDAVSAILPAGTLSGAPKLRACEIIQNLEGARRGIYGGAIGYLDFSGNMDVCIAIRLAYKKAGTVCVQSGAGIVADSVPQSEFTECVNKARAVAEALAEGEAMGRAITEAKGCVQ